MAQLILVEKAIKQESIKKLGSIGTTLYICVQ